MFSLFPYLLSPPSLWLLLVSVFTCDKVSCTACANSQTTGAETDCTHDNVTDSDYPECKHVQYRITIVQRVVNRRGGVGLVVAVNPDVSCYKPCEKKEIQDSINELAGHGLILIDFLFFISRAASSLT